MENIATRQKRSEKLTAQERKDFKRFIDGCGTINEAADQLELSRFTISDVKAKGTGRPDTIAKIRSKINSIATV